ncbi:MAG: patatin-like phospholipase family protein [Acidimicrobiales bacterium]|jgi:NTE family protein|nr:patatin-like phospholipase family protein [Actinomycetota bacterium]
MTVAFALSEGGNLGAMQAGAIRALLEAGVEPDLLVGTSVGALNAAFCATHPGVDGARELQAAWGALSRREAFRFNVAGAFAGLLGMRDHLVSTTRLRHLIRRWLPIERIEDAPVPFAAVATDALSGEVVVLRHGDVVDALTASSAIPGLFPPVRVGGRWLVDGGLAAGWPVTEALDLGADTVYLFTTATAPARRPPRGVVAMTMNSVALVTAKLQQERLVAAKRQAAARGGLVVLVPSPAPEAPSPFDFARGDLLASAAYQHVQQWLDDNGGPDRLGGGSEPITLARGVADSLVGEAPEPA